MRVLKNILIGLGLVFALFMAMAVVLGISAAHFKAEHKAFVTAYVTDLSRHWDVADVYDRSTNTMVQLATNTQGRQFLHRASGFGLLQSVQDIEMSNYNVGTGGTTAVFSFKGIFENDETVVTVTVIQRAGALRVQGIQFASVPGDVAAAPARTQT